MSGLIQKDFLLLMQRKSAIVIFLIVGVFMGFSTDGSFVVGYLTMLTAILSISTISYDEYDNGYPFLLTLPISRKMYVQSKYMFSLMMGLIGWAFAMVVYIICSLAKGKGFQAIWILDAVVFIPVFAVILAIMLPLQLKYGAEGSRVVLMVVAGSVAAVVVLVKKFVPAGAAMPTWLDDVNELTVVVVLMLVGVVATAVSYLCGVRVMNKKTF